MNNGVVEVYQSSSQTIRDAIDKVVVQVYRKKHESGHSSFLLTGASAGCGTTYTAINMTVALATAGWKTVLVDCDIRKGMPYKRLNEGVNKGLSDYLMRECGSPVYATNQEGLDYVPCGQIKESPVRLLCTKAMEDFAVWLGNQYDFVIYDFPSLDIVPDAGILMPIVDDVIIVAAAESTTTEQLHKTRNKVKSYPDKYLGVILNKLDMEEYKHCARNYDYFGEHNMSEKHKDDMKYVADKMSKRNGEKHERTR